MVTQSTRYGHGTRAYTIDLDLNAHLMEYYFMKCTFYESIKCPLYQCYETHSIMNVKPIKSIDYNLYIIFQCYLDENCDLFMTVHVDPEIVST